MFAAGMCANRWPDECWWLDVEATQGNEGGRKVGTTAADAFIN